MLRNLVAIVLSVAAVSCSRPESRAEAAPTPKADSAPQKVAGPRAEGQGFVVEVEAPREAKVGGQVLARVVLTPNGGYHVNKEFPTQLTVTPPAGVDLPMAKQKPADAARFEEDGAVFEVAFTPKAAGEKRFEASFRFAVCTAETCDPKSEKLAWTVPVK